MRKTAGYFLFLTTFLGGAILGGYLALPQSFVANESNAKENLVSVQDTVIRNLVEENTQPLIVPTVVEETKLSPYAKMTIEKHFTRCGHTTIDERDIPLELINMTESEVRDKYENWDILNFNSKELHLSRTINSNCDDHFVIREKDGKLAIYKNMTGDITSLIEETSIDVLSLPSGDREALGDGILVYGTDELSRIIEDFES